MVRTISPLFGLVVAAASAQACSRANATGRPAGTPVAATAVAAPATQSAFAVIPPAVAALPAARDLEVAAGQPLELRTLSGLTSRSNHAGDRIEAVAVTAALAAGGDTAIPAGGAAGGVYANATRDLDIVLPAGSVVHVTLAAPFDRPMAVK